MKNSKLLLTTALFAGLMFSSCKKEDYKKDITPIGGGELSGKVEFLAVPKTDGLKVAIYGSANGEVAETIRKSNIENYALNMSNVQLLPSTGTLVMDIDEFNSQNEKIFWSYYDEAFKNNNLIIFESGSKNMKSINEFFNSQFGGISTEGDIFAFGVYKYNADGRIICPMGKKFDYTANDILNEYFTSYTRYKFIADSTMSDSKTEKVTSSSLKVGAAAKYQFTNITPEEAASRVAQAEHLLYAERRIANVEWQGTINYGTKSTTGVKEEVVHSGEYHDATGKCPGQQQAGFSAGKSYTVKWNVGLSLANLVPGGSLLSNIAKGVGIQTEKSETSGTTNSSTLKMMKQYAQGVVVRKIGDHKGPFIGVVTLEVVLGSTKPSRFYVNITYTAGNGQAKWDGIKPIYGSKNTFKWVEWGKQLSCPN